MTHTPPGWIEPETVRVRPEAALDLAVVDRFLRPRLPNTDGPLEVVQFAGGHANLTYLLRFGTQEYVLRRPPSGPVAPGAYDMAREFRALSALWPVFPPAPRPFLLCEDASVLGALYRRLSEAMIDTLAALHAVDYKAVGLETLGKPEGFLERQVNSWIKRWERAKVVDIALLDELSRWLLAHLPRSQAPTLLHNDYKLDNLLVDPADIARIVALFDWDQCTLGDPLVDLGLLLNYWTQADDTPGRQALAQAPTTLPGFYTRADLAQRYAERSGRDVSAISFYQTFALWKTAIVVMQLFVLYQNGQLQDERLHDFNQRAVLLAEAAHAVTQAPAL